MIRPAKFSDILRMIELLDEMHSTSKYAGRVNVSHKAAHRLLQQCIHRHGFEHDGGSLAMVAMKDQKIEGFMIGILDRVYHIGDKLAANDVFLYCTKKAHPTDFLRLFDAYVNWAEKNPKVVEIRASWTDAREDAARIEQVYERKGFRKCGSIFEKVNEEPAVATKALAALERVEP